MQFSKADRDIGFMFQQINHLIMIIQFNFDVGIALHKFLN